MKKCFIKDRHELMAKNISHCFICKLKIGPTMEERTQAKINTLPQEIKEKFMDLLLSGKSLGEASKAAGIEDTMVAAGILLSYKKTVDFIQYKDKVFA